jgi:hypothetical protein
MRAALPALLALAVSIPACQNAPKPTPESAVELLRSHYRKINDKHFEDAFKDWEGEGKASGKSLAAFINGYVQTPRVEVTPGTPSPIEGAAGSRFITVPVHVTAYKVGGYKTEYSGQYVLRYSVVEGAKPRYQWRIYSQKLERAAPADSTS